MHHPKADIDRLYVKRTEGGTGPLQIQSNYEAEIINICRIFEHKYTEDQ